MTAGHASSGRARGPIALVLVVAMAAAGLVAAIRPAAAAAESRCHTAPPVSGGVFHTMGLHTDGSVWTWGDNTYGQLGNGSAGGGTLTPIQLSAITGATAVEAGWDYSFALMPDGSVSAWGINEDGVLGLGDTVTRTSPTPVPGLGDVASISAGCRHALALKEDGTVWAWGRNDLGQLGQGNTIGSTVPVQVPGLTDVVAVSAGCDQSLALLADGTVKSWGRNADGELGIGSTTDSLVPVSISGLSGVTAVEAGSRHSLALRSDGGVKSWGGNWVGQLGDGTWDMKTSPVSVSGLSGVTAIEAGGVHNLVLKSDGTTWAWGFNLYGQLGTGNNWDSEVPVQSQMSEAAGFNMRANTSVAVATDGRIWNWGDNWDGQLGTGDTDERWSPFRVTDPRIVLPGAPSDVHAVAGEELGYLTWAQPDAVATHYVITPYVNGVAQTPQPTDLPRAAAAARNLSQGTTYTFTVTPQNCLGAGTASSQSNKVVPTGVQLDHEGFKVEGTRLTDRMDLSVNTFNGDLGVEATDLQIAGTGLDLVLARTWHSRSDQASIFGDRWASTVGDDVFLEFVADDSVMFHGPGGGTAGFVKDGGVYETPAGVDATLRFDDNGTATDTSDDFYVLEAFTGSEKFVFDATSGNLTRREDRNGNSLTYTYSGPGGALSSITDTQSRSLSFSYNVAGLVDEVADPLGRVVSYGYDADGNLTSYVDASGTLTTFTYTSGDLTSVTTPAGRKVDLTYDGLDRVEAVTWPLASGAPTTTFTYEFERTIVTDANGNDTTYRYDPVGRTTGVTDALGNVTSMEYTSHSNVRQYTPGGGGTTTFGYTSVHALNSAEAPTGAEFTYTYADANHPHLPTRVTDPQGKNLHYTYDARGNTTRLENDLPSQNQVDVGYDSKGNPTSSTDPKADATTYTYDAQGNLTGVTPPSPLGAIGPITYDAVSRPVTIADGTGKTTTFEYDALDRVTEITYDDGSTVTRGYDGDGNLTTEKDALGTTTMSFDPRGRLVSRTTPDGVTVGYGYDQVGNLTSLTDPSGTITYGYNAVNLATSVKLPESKTITLTYDASYNRTSVAFPDGTSQNYTFDDSNRVTRVAIVKGSTTLERFDYSYANPATGNIDSGLRFSVTDLAGNKTAYTYDDLNRLEKARTSTPSGALVVEFAYTYDGAANRLTQSITRPTIVGSGIDMYAYNAANQLETVNGENLAYDGNGNLTGSDFGAEYVYDAADRTTAIRPRADRGLPLRFLYRGAGQVERLAAGVVAEHVTTGGPVCVPGSSCVPDPNEVAATTTYTHSALGLSAEETAGVRTSYVRDPAGNLLAQRSAGATQYLLADGLGSVVRIHDHSAGTVATYRYDPFGNVLEASGDPEITPFRFAGYYLDATGLYKTGHRYYDPFLGRFTQQDPVYDYFDPKLWNRYVYVGNDPVNFVDPSGLNAVSDFFTKTIPCAARGFARSAKAGFAALAGGLIVGEFMHAVEGIAVKRIGDAIAKAILGTVGLVAGAVIGYHVFQESKKAGGCG